MPDLVSVAIRKQLAEDTDDLAICEERRNESTVAFENFVKELKRDGKV